MTAILIVGAEAADYPSARGWAPATFELFIAVDHRIDASVIADRALAQGLLHVAAWGPGCTGIEDMFDEAYVGDGTRERTAANLLVTTSHPDESLEDALDVFLNVEWLRDRAPGSARIIFALGELGPRITAILATRATREAAQDCLPSSASRA